MAKRLKYLILHCSATPEGRDVQPADIIRAHTSPPPQGRGWSKVGYRGVITLDGIFHKLVDVNDNEWVEANEITNGAKGYNDVSHHICYIGGMDKGYKYAKDTRTKAQKERLTEIVGWYIAQFPNIKVIGHNQVSSKQCPSFDVFKWLEELGWSDNGVEGKIRQ